MDRSIQHVFLIGAKSLGAYGGFETFIDKLTEYHRDNRRIQYHVACKANGDGSMDESKTAGVSGIIKDKKGNTREFWYHKARCFKIPVPNIGPAQAIYYDLMALLECCRYIEKHHIPSPIVYIMACRIGPFMAYFCRRIHKSGGKVYINPDGHEWMRAKWSAPIRKYWKMSEKMMVCASDLVVCDSVNIEAYIHGCYDGKCRGGGNPKTCYIAYGAEVSGDTADADGPALQEWLSCHGLQSENYYLVVGRFVPENNYETMIREFMASTSSRPLAIITNVNDKFLSHLEQKLHFSLDHRIKFVGTVYDQKLLSAIRKNAYAYLHGHEVGGTNPSLLEALGATKLNLLLDVGFNREVAADSALYWTKEPGNMAALIERSETLEREAIAEYGRQAKKRIYEHYSWEFISRCYEEIFCS